MSKNIKTIGLAGAALAGALALGGCYDDGYNGGVAVGYGGGPYYDGYGYGYGEPYYDGYAGGGYYGGYGWYDGFYYPGAGFYVYDRGGHRHRWTDAQRDHWRATHGGEANGRAGDGRRYPGWGRGQGDGQHGQSAGAAPAPGTQAAPPPRQGYRQGFGNRPAPGGRQNGRGHSPH